MKTRKKVIIFVLAAVMCLSLALAACKSNDITVKLVPNGGQMSSIKVDGADAVPELGSDGTQQLLMPKGSTIELGIPTYTGHTFEGWFSNEQCTGSPLSFPVKLSQDTTFYAKWSGGSVTPEPPTGYTLTLDPNGGLVDPRTLSNVTQVNESDLPTPEMGGSDFLGWYLDQSCTNKVTFPYTLIEDKTFYASWTRPVLDYTVTFHNLQGATLAVTVNGSAAAIGNDGNGNPQVDVQDEDEINVVTPTQKGATFRDWYSDAQHTHRVSMPYTVSSNVDLYADWQIDQTTDPEDAAKLAALLNSNTTSNFGASYLMSVSTSESQFDPMRYVYTYVDGNVYEVGQSLVSGQWEASSLSWGFRAEQGYDIYTSDPAGSYFYRGQSYTGTHDEDAQNLEAYFYMVYLDKLSQLDASKFFLYNGWWYATDEYVDQAGQLILGNTSGEPDSFNPVYKNFALHFTNDVIDSIAAESTVTVITPLPDGTGSTTGDYNYNHRIGILQIGDLLFPTESEFLQDKERPSGLYPELNPNDVVRNSVQPDGLTHTTEQLSAALKALTGFTSYYTFAGLTYDGYIYTPVTIKTSGDKGVISIDNYSYEINGYETTQSAAADRYFLYKHSEDAFFLIVGNNVYSDSYTFRNSYDYNYYLKGVDNAITYNCRYPATYLKYLDATKFSFNAEGGYFEYADASTLTAVGKSIFGDNDLVYPEMGETESYTYLRLYMNGSNVVRVLATSRIELYGESYEYFTKEVVITSHEDPAVTLPDGTEQKCVIKGEAKANGSIAALEAAFSATDGAPYKYTDEFVYDDYDELGGIYGGEQDIYIQYNGITKSNNYTYLYFKNGALYYYDNDKKVGGAVTLESLNGDVEKANEWLLWAQPITRLINAEMFYEGVDGVFYGKAEQMDALSKAIGRYSGSEWLLENDASLTFSDSYRWSVVLDFVSLTVSNGKLDTLYYSGSIHVAGSSGSHDKPFVGQAKFGYDVSPLTLPNEDEHDASFPALQQYLNPKYTFSVSNQGILTFNAVPNAASYDIKVYDTATKTTLIAQTNVDDNTPFDLTTLDGITVTEQAKKYFVSITAKGDGVTWLDAAESEQQQFELSSLPKLSTPTVNIDAKTGVLTVTVPDDADADGFWYGVYRSLSQDPVKSANVTEEPYTVDLKSLGLAENTTYTVQVYLRHNKAGTNRDSDAVTITYTTTGSDGARPFEALLAAFDYSQSFSADLISQSSAKYYVLPGTSYTADQLLSMSSNELSKLAKQCMKLSFDYDKTLNKGKANFSLVQGADTYSGEVLRNFVYSFAVQDDQLVGSYTLGGSDEAHSLTTDLWFGGLTALDPLKFVELEGGNLNWPGVTYRYNGDLSAVQALLAKASPLDEMLGGGAITYKGFEVGVNYSSDGAFGNACTMTFIGEYNDDTIVAKFDFGSFGKDLANWVK